MISKTWLLVSVTALALALAAVSDARKFTDPYDCYVIFGAIRRCYNGQSLDLVRCSIAGDAASDQSVFEPRSMGQEYPFGTSVVTLQKVIGDPTKVYVATFQGEC
ncbi:hypothetical protein BGZ83_011897 [Gryganskiella cystojenkinii]|nr:hypothetical protein BGZ83_011897 [Gryganskiella cystojenkinii]